jgi:hypothetical protein
MKTLRLVLCVFAFCGVFHTSSFGQGLSADLLPKDYEVRTAEAAVAKALQYTGFDKGRRFSLKNVTEAAHLITVQDSTNEFLRGQLTNRIVWSITFDEVILDYPDSTLSPSDIQSRSFDVLIDPDTGHLLKVTSQSEDYDRKVLSSGPWANIDDNLIPWTQVVITTPNTPPTIPLLEIITQLSYKNPSLAKVITAYCLSYTWTGEQPKPALFGGQPDSVRDLTVWLIIVKDFQTQDHTGSIDIVTDVQSVGFYCDVINATTGQVIISGTRTIGRR